MFEIMREIMWNSRDHVSCEQHLDVMYMYTIKKLKKLQLFRNLNGAYVILINVYNLQLVNKVKMERIIVVDGKLWIRILKKGNIFRGWVAKFHEKFSCTCKRNLWFSLLSDEKNYNIDSCVCWMFRVKVEQSILFAKFMNQYFERKLIMFFRLQ